MNTPFASQIYEGMALNALVEEGLQPKRIERIGLLWRAVWDREHENAVRLAHNRIYRKGSTWMIVAGHGCDIARDEVYLTFALKASV